MALKESPGMESRRGTPAHVFLNKIQVNAIFLSVIRDIWVVVDAAAHED
jgi:hypothetical protein